MWNSSFSNLQGKRKSVDLKNHVVREIGEKITVFDWGEGKDFWFELSVGLKSRGFEKSRSVPLEFYF